VTLVLNADNLSLYRTPLIDNISEQLLAVDEAKSEPTEASGSCLGGEWRWKRGENSSK
jgi:hypothetical protein